MRFKLVIQATRCFATLVAVVAAMPPQYAAAQPPDVTLYTRYNFAPSSFSWVTCGSTSTSEGCFDSGTVSGFGNACAIVADGVTGTNTNFLQRIFVLDSNATGKNDVALHVLSRHVYVNTSGFAFTTFTKAGDVSLRISGGNGVRCFAADNSSIVAAATSTSPSAAIVQKSSLSVSGLGGFSPPVAVTGITADASGYISVNYASALNPIGAFYLLGPNGSATEDGGGNVSLIPLHNAIVP